MSIWSGARHRRTKSAAPRFDVWLNPSAGRSVSGLASQLGERVHLVVVPKTGSRLADIAVLPDADAAELEGLAKVLPQLRLLATSPASPSARLRAAADRVGARLLTNPTPAELLTEITRTCQRDR